jgi:hypothetical protein
VSLAGAAAYFAEPLRHGLTAASEILGGGFPGYNLYPARQGWIAVAALERHFQQLLHQELGLAALTNEGLRAAFATRTAGEWETWAVERGLPITAVNDIGARTNGEKPEIAPG